MTINKLADPRRAAAASSTTAPRPRITQQHGQRQHLTVNGSCTRLPGCRHGGGGLYANGYVITFTNVTLADNSAGGTAPSIGRQLLRRQFAAVGLQERDRVRRYFSGRRATATSSAPTSPTSSGGNVESADTCGFSAAAKSATPIRCLRRSPTTAVPPTPARCWRGARPSTPRWTARRPPTSAACAPGGRGLRQRCVRVRASAPAPAGRAAGPTAPPVRSRGRMRDAHRQRARKALRPGHARADPEAPASSFGPPPGARAAGWTATAPGAAGQFGVGYPTARIPRGRRPRVQQAVEGPG